MSKSLYIDTEWFPGAGPQRLFLVGFASGRTVSQIYGKALSQKRVISLFDDHDFVWVYGPDVGVLERYTGTDLRRRASCFNGLKMMRNLYPDLPSHRLSFMETHLGFKREVKKYKSNIFQIERDWKDPKKRLDVLKYNRDDVANLRLLIKHTIKVNKLSIADLLKYRL